MSRSVRTSEPIPKYRRYLRLIAPLPALWCHALKAEAFEKVQGRVRRLDMKIVQVLTSHDQLGNTGRKTGFWLEEGAAPYFVFRDAGVEGTLASPKGGQPPIDPKIDEPGNQTPAQVRFKKDAEAIKAFANTVKLADVK